MTRDDGEMETVSVEDASWNGDLNDMMQKQRARALTALARLRPGFPTTAALVARESHRDFDGHCHAAPCVGGRYMDRRVPARWLVHEESSADAVHGKGHRRKVDHHFIGEAADVHTTIVSCHESNGLTEGTEGISSHSEVLVR